MVHLLKRENNSQYLQVHLAFRAALFRVIAEGQEGDTYRHGKRGRRGAKTNARSVSITIFCEGYV